MSAGRPVSHIQLEALAKELDEATAHAASLVARVSGEDLHRRPRPESWSAAECLAHLNLTSEAMLPQIDRRIAECRSGARMTTRRYRRDLVGWFLSAILEPPYKQKFKTTARFVPISTGSGKDLLERFSSLQGQLVRELDRVAGLDMHRVKVTSAFNSRVRYNLYAAFRVITAHQRRHLYQADMALPK